MNRKNRVKFGYFITFICFLISVIFRIKGIYINESHGLIGIGGILLLIIIVFKISTTKQKNII